MKEVSNELRKEARHALRGLSLIGSAFAASWLFGLALTVALPRCLGASVLGAWYALRGVVVLGSMLSGLGSVQNMGVHSSPQDPHHEALIYKFIVCMRSLFGLLAAGVVAAVVSYLPPPLGGVHVALPAALSTMLMNATVSLLLLPYAARDRKMLAWMQVLEAALVPGLVLWGYPRGGVGVLAWVALIGDIVLLAVAVIGARRHWRWGADWPERTLRRSLNVFGGYAALAATGSILLVNGSPALMRAIGWPPDAVGHAGLGLKLGQALLGLLMTVSTSLLPSLAVVREKAGVMAALRWQARGTRWGAGMLIACLAVGLWVGPDAVGLLWGPKFSRGFPLMLICAATALPLWIGSQFNQRALLFDAPAAAGVNTLYLGIGMALMAIAPPAVFLPLAVALLFMLPGELVQRSLGIPAGVSPVALLALLGWLALAWPWRQGIAAGAWPVWTSAVWLLISGGLVWAACWCRGDLDWLRTLRKTPRRPVYTDDVGRTDR